MNWFKPDHISICGHDVTHDVKRVKFTPYMHGVNCIKLGEHLYMSPPLNVDVEFNDGRIESFNQEHVEACITGEGRAK